MKEKWNVIKNKTQQMWQDISKKQKTTYIVGFALILVIVISIALISTSTKYIALPYTNLSIEEVGQIKEELDNRNVPYELDNGGTVIKVPEEESDSLLVDLAGLGIPHSGSIDYSFFSENASWGVTDNEFNLMKLDAMQTELGNLIKGIDGIEDADVMITLPNESVFLNDEKEEASASIVLQTDFGFEFKGTQIDTLQQLVSAAIPDLPSENIVIMNQYFEYFDEQSTNVVENEYEFQQNVKKDIEQDIQKRLQQMLGAMVGLDRVVVSVTADIDYTNENRTEELVEPVDIDNMEGIPVSVESVQETFEGNQAAGGVVGTGEEDIPNYPAGANNEDGDYELVKETINYELNRIHREISESPYKLRDLGIQVVVDNVLEENDDDIVLLSQQEQTTVEEGIASILNSMITTSIDKEYGDIEPEEKVSIVFQPFKGTTQPQPAGEMSNVPTWVYVGGVIVALIIIGLIILLLRRKNTADDTVRDESAEQLNEVPIDVQNIEEIPKSDADVQKEQLEKMAKDKPEDFAKLLRTWISGD